MINIAGIVGFDWDTGNSKKNQEKHNVSQYEAEQVFFNKPILLLSDEKHSSLKCRYHAYGKTDDGRKLHVTFTVRDSGQKIRVISARDMHKKERKFYDEQS
ncbi:BrnT family toxin [Endozoicomonas sp. 4G]|uniref:BrnT family toxin n=1 Tax=Endozoicomonas sp. 4G TaxID=2872754 RepID=UPI002078F03E|nr:BrnT family toxin [Endozoicomonas sp. 4G]